jgi:short-subunit dehydrogenase
MEKFGLFRELSCVPRRNSGEYVDQHEAVRGRGGDLLIAAGLHYALKTLGVRMQNVPAAWRLRLWPWRSSVDANAVRAAREAVAHLKPAVVITGGSRGIGFALARQFVEAGRDTVIVARSAPGLSEAAAELETSTGVKVTSILCDISEPNASDVIAVGLAEAGLYFDVLINNAGIGLAGPFVTHAQNEISRLIALNIEALTRLTRAALPDMIARQRGGILNVASLGAHVPGPNQAAYYASKSYVVSLTEAIASEVSGRGVRVSALLPGPVDSTFHNAMGAEASLYRLVLPSMSPERVAKSAYRGFIFGQRVIVPGVVNAVMFVVLRFLPHALTVPFVYWLLKRPENLSGR